MLEKEVIPGERPLGINSEKLISDLAWIRTHGLRICTYLPAELQCQTGSKAGWHRNVWINWITGWIGKWMDGKMNRRDSYGYFTPIKDDSR